MTDIVVRCPCCSSGDAFRLMVAVSNGRFVCDKCGHLAIPGDPTFKCACRRCFEQSAFDARRCDKNPG